MLSTAIPNPYPPNSGTLALNDPLSDNSLGYFWNEENDSGGSCGFNKGAYHVLSYQQGKYHYCSAFTTNFSNFAFEIQMTIVQGDAAGIVFRMIDAYHTFYFFGINSQGNYTLDANNGTDYLLQSGNTSDTNAKLFTT